MDNIIGHKIKEIRPMTQEELDQNCWDGEGTTIVLDNGVKLYPSVDPEGNGPGTIFGNSPDGQFFILGL